MILEDARPYVARAIGDAALQFVWLSLKDAAIRVVRNCVCALAEGWREERMRRELFALSNHLLKDIGLSRSEIEKPPGCSRSCPAELWLADVARASGEGGNNEIRTHLALGKDAPLRPTSRLKGPFGASAELRCQVARVARERRICHRFFQSM